MSDLGDTGIGATLGAVIVGALATAREMFQRKRRRSDPPEQIDDPSLAGRVGRLTERVMQVEQEQARDRQELLMLKQKIQDRFDTIEESVDELLRSRVKTDELLPLIKEQIHELRQDLRSAERRRADTNKE